MVVQGRKGHRTLVAATPLMSSSHRLILFPLALHRRVLAFKR